MGKNFKIGKWPQVPAYLPPGWHECVAQLALDINRSKTGRLRFVWAVAIDNLLALKPEQVRKRVRELEALDEEDWAALCALHSVTAEAAEKAIQAERAKRRSRKPRTA